MKTGSIKNGVAHLYRWYSLRKDTPPIPKTLYTDRKGSITELKQKYGNETVQKYIYLGNILELSGDKYCITNNGIEDIEVFYKKQNPFMLIKNILFGVLSKLY